MSTPTDHAQAFDAQLLQLPRGQWLLLFCWPCTVISSRAFLTFQLYIYSMLFLFFQRVIDSCMSALHILLGPWKSPTHIFLVLQAGGHFMAMPFLCWKFCWAHRSSMLLQLLLNGRFCWVYGTSMLVQLLLNAKKKGLHIFTISASARPEPNKFTQQGGHFSLADAPTWYPSDSH